MKTLDQITRTLGKPRALQTLRSGSRTLAAIARWRHGGAFIDLTDTDAYHVVFNVSGGQTVEVETQQGHLPRLHIQAGSISMNAPEHPAKVTILGEADSLHILMTREWIESVSGGAKAIGMPRLAVCEPQFRAAAAQTLVALERTQRRSRPQVDILARMMANHFVNPVIESPEMSSGGLSPGARRRVWTLMEKRLGDSTAPSPKIDELAAAAGLSVHHFIKAFRRTEGQTPHARLIASRLERAFHLLLQRDARVDQISDETGFSSPAHFVSVFRKHLGVTPGALRDAALLRH